MLKPRAKKKAERMVDAIYNRIGNGVQINIMDIGKIFAAGEAAYEKHDGNVDFVQTAVEQAIKVLRLN